MRRAVCLIILGVLTLIGVLVNASSGSPDPPSWAEPSAMALKRVSPVASTQAEPALLNNMDCQLLDYRLTTDSGTRTGCFTQTAFGLMDSDSSTVIFNGTDEGLPLSPMVNNQVLVPWPQAGSLLGLDTAPTGGSYLGLYRNPSGSLQDKRNLIGQITAKQLAAGPDFRLSGPSGQPLLVNAQTLAFSGSGAWLVAESLSGSFVRINLATLSMLPFAPSYAADGSYGLQQSRVAISHDGHYAAIANNAVGAFKLYDLTACGNPTVVNLSPLNCKVHDYWSFVAQQIGGLKSVRHVRFVNDGLVSFEVTANDPNKDGIYVLSPTANITSLINYLGVGDSYASGEGAFDYMNGTADGQNVCHLSARSYPVLLSNDLFGGEAGHSVACSGAVIDDVGSTSDSYTGQIKNGLSAQQLEETQPALLNSVMTNFIPGYVAQQRFVRQYQPGLATVMVGGNDVGFGDIVEQCVESRLSLHLSDSTCFNTYEDRKEVEQLVDRTVPRWQALYKELLEAAPGSRLYAVGYPQIAVDIGTCALNVHLNKSELEFAAELIDYLNGGIEQAATKAGIPYIDISQALAGHRLCEAVSYDVAVNGLTAGNDAKVLGVAVFGHESYHPNALGHRLIEQAILKQTHNFQTSPSPKPSLPDKTALLNKPKTGRVANIRQPIANLTPKVVKAGQVTTLRIGQARGLKPATGYVIRLDGPTGTPLGTVMAGRDGSLDGIVNVPVDTPPGGHTVDVTGPNQAGEPIDVVQPIVVPVSNSDADGDGFPDSSDSCPYAVNSGVDADQDGIDDTCDGFIGQPSNPGTSGSTGSVSGNSKPSGGTNNGGGPGNSVNLSAHPVIAANFTGANGTVSLGDKTINPATTNSKKLELPVAEKQMPPNSTLPGLRTIYLLPWLVLPILIWLLVLLLYMATRRLGKNIYQKPPLSTTISL